METFASAASILREKSSRASRVMNLPTNPDAIHFATLHPEDGRALRYHFDEFMADWIPRLAAELMTTDHGRVAAQHLDQELLSMYLEQALYLDLLGVARALFRRSYAKRYGAAWQKPTKCPARLAGLVAAHWPDEAATTIVSDALRSRIGRLRFNARSLAEWALTRFCHRSSRSFSAAMVAVELAEGADPRSKCDAFWLAQDAVSPERVLFTMERHNALQIDACGEYERIARLGAHAVALHPSFHIKAGVPMWFPRGTPFWAGALKRSLPPAIHPAEQWLKTALEHCADRVGYWESFFAEHNVAVCQQFTELSTETALKRLALRRAGGLEVGKMRSQFFDPASAAFHFQHEIAFVWHARVEHALRASRTRTRCVVETGYVYDQLFEVCRPAAETLRSELVAAGVKTVLAAYDNHPHINGHFNDEQLRDFYHCVIEVVEGNPGLGLIVKSKKPQVLAMMPDVRERLIALSRQGRCSISSAAGVSVAGSALACDIAVGFPASTAVCEAMCAGRRGLMYDPSGGADAWLAEAGNALAFRDLSGFREALVGAVYEGTGARSDPQHAARLAIDRFRDGRAFERAATFVNALLAESSERQKDRDALRRAAVQVPCARLVEQEERGG